MEFTAVKGSRNRFDVHVVNVSEIFAKRAMSREGQLQVELAMLEYRLTRGPRVTGDTGRDSGAGGYCTVIIYGSSYFHILVGLKRLINNINTSKYWVTYRA